MPSIHYICILGSYSSTSYALDSTEVQSQKDHIRGTNLRGTSCLGSNSVDIQRKPYLRRAATGMTRRIVGGIGGNVRADGMDPVWNGGLVGVLVFISTSFASRTGHRHLLAFFRLPPLLGRASERGGHSTGDDRG
jgi:hypothetical protein